jgi:hypothetical protein
MPYPIEPSPMTAMHGFCDSGMEVSLFSRFLGQLCPSVPRLGRAAKA